METSSTTCMAANGGAPPSNRRVVLHCTVVPEVPHQYKRATCPQAIDKPLLYIGAVPRQNMKTNTDTQTHTTIPFSRSNQRILSDLSHCSVSFTVVAPSLICSTSFVLVSLYLCLPSSRSQSTSPGPLQPVQTDYRLELVKEVVMKKV